MVCAVGSTAKMRVMTANLRVPWRRTATGQVYGRGGRVRLLLLVLAAFCSAAGVSLVKSAAQQSPSAVFPTVSSYSLDKQKILLPQGLEGRVNLLLLSFAPNQQGEVGSWTATAQSLEHTNFAFRAYRVPVAERENALFRWWANASLRSTESDPEQWRSVVPLYVDLHRFLAQLAIPGEDNAVALLVDKGGRVFGRAHGASTPETRSALVAAANALHEQP